ncbi:MAG: retropepsin-like aspartic protease [Vicinamibacterales bacterium]
MTGHHCLHYAVAATVALLLSPPLLPTAGADEPAAEVPFRQPWTGAVVVPVTANGMGPYSFLVDTGSSHTAVSERLASQLGAPRVAKTQLSSTGGDTWAAVVRISHLSVAALDVRDVLATELPPGGLFDTGTIDGVLGRDVLERRSFTIDYRRQVLQWTDAVESRSVSLALDVREPVWFVTVDSEGSRLRLIPDSGATGMVVFDRGQWPCLRQLSGTAGVETVTRHASGRIGELRQLNIGGERLVNQRVTVLDGTQVAATHGDGLLPLHWFDRVTFDLARGHLILGRASTGRMLASALREPGVQTE